MSLKCSVSHFYLLLGLSDAKERGHGFNVVIPDIVLALRTESHPLSLQSFCK